MAHTGTSPSLVLELHLFVPTEITCWSDGLVPEGEEEYVEEIIGLVEDNLLSLAGDYFPNAEKVTVARSEHNVAAEAWYPVEEWGLIPHNSGDSEIEAALDLLITRAHHMAEEEIERWDAEKRLSEQ